MTLISANDRFEILDLCARYNRCLDGADEEGAMDCWAKSGISFDNGKSKITNWDQLRRNLAKELHDASMGSKRLVQFNTVVREGESVDSAYVDSEYMIIGAHDHLIHETGSFKNDKVVRTSMGWKFQSRVQKADVVKNAVPSHRPEEVHPR
ncbi:nuclear transport factor 2 family protein [Bdellovibrio sp. NC01]|uniref:nuclear transport factor 2 family protein n=1 Tax=Bdellovibrio sp. NC01 TaxID=2220073 RepID=UPI00115B6174|nr:nuclear transport factor 2 family protein [Bdellovibrio sp. NC01]QDK37188.1 hypothetical protein DOE51_06080 [Bdellovibrio sp. NC01]